MLLLVVNNVIYLIRKTGILRENNDFEDTRFSTGKSIIACDAVRYVLEIICEKMER